MEQHLSALSESAQDYLKAIWTIGEVSGSTVTVGALATRMEVAPSTASEAVRRLEVNGLITHAPYGDIKLSPTGETLALAMVRRHRLLETFLVLQLGYSWDEVQREADRLEHAVSDKFLARLDALLGHPTTDPHGDPIPTADGKIDAVPTVSLAEVQAGHTVTIVRILDARPDLLRYLSGLGLHIGTELAVQDVVEAAEIIQLVAVADPRSCISLSLAAAGPILVRMVPVEVTSARHP